ncbi:helix-turn-helix domain-containing protein [Sphaerisporangium sp. NPDC051017]|uniref:helix-turn-helix domain-containing protein n=1 Tax=Sphaerisporangium sp. NPDC051017 TaxID=3154636 RepID=UPI0034192136
MSATPSKPGPLADRLEHLFQTVYPKGGKPYTNVEVAESINAAAGEKVISQAYVWQLRKGIKDNPTKRHLAALAAFFGVSVLYFFEDETEDGATAPATKADLALRDEAVKEVALRAAGLSDETLKTIQDMIDRARTLEGLPAVNEQHRA